MDGSGGEETARHLLRRHAKQPREPDPPGKLHRSWTGMYRVQGRHYRPIGELVDVKLF